MFARLASDRPAALAEARADYIRQVPAAVRFISADPLGSSGTKTRSCRVHVLVDEPTEEISPFDVGHTVGPFDESETLGYLKLQSSPCFEPRRPGSMVTAALRP
jgi:hypothetical protein